ncbi:MAG TPA: VWA domain-containing protein [Acidimicrobiales bacterium]|nr:VWA domain-containing protein [Acidimicrobiales bacterium]
MTLLSPAKLWLLLVVVALAIGYVWLQKQRRKRAVRHPDVRLVAAVSGKRASWRRHLVAGALGFAIIALIVGLARPAQSEQVPREEAVVMLAIDESGSMLANDIQPSRLEAAVAQAKRFIENAPANYKIGLVGFDDSGHTLAPPTTDHQSVIDALGRLQRGHGTAAGEGLYTALDDIKAATQDNAITSDRPYSAVVLLADGANTIGRPLTDAAQAAADQKVPVFTIAYGTPDGTVEVNGQSVAVPSDPQSMADVAQATGGQTFTAESGDELASVYSEIGTTIGHITVQKEFVVACALVALVAMIVALGGSMMWNPRLV